MAYVWTFINFMAFKFFQRAEVILGSASARSKSVICLDKRVMKAYTLVAYYQTASNVCYIDRVELAPKRNELSARCTPTRSKLNYLQVTVITYNELVGSRGMYVPESLWSSLGERFGHATTRSSSSPLPPYRPRDIIWKVRRTGEAHPVLSGLIGR